MMSQSGLRIHFRKELSFIESSRPVSPDIQVEICFLRLPPGFPAAPKYFNHVSVGPGPSQNR